MDNINNKLSSLTEEELMDTTAGGFWAGLGIATLIILGLYNGYMDT